MKKPIEFIRGKKTAEKKKRFDAKKLFGDKKSILTGMGCLALIAVAIWANVTLTAKDGTLKNAAADELVNAAEITEPEAEVTEEEQDYLSVFRAQKDATRAEELNYLEEIVKDENSDSEAVSQAQSSRLSIIDSMEKEMVIEGLIMAKGFGDVAVTVSTGSVNVVIDNESLQDEQIAQILDIAVSETGASPEQIKIMPVQ